MKKLFSIFLILILITTLIGCAPKSTIHVAPPVKASTTDDTKQKASAQKIRLQANTNELLKQKQLDYELAKEAAQKQLILESTKTVYLTFDDGPSSGTIPLLDILDKYNIKATFFVTGMYYPNTKGLYGEIKKRGHTIGVHSMSHKYSKIYTSVDAFFSDLDQIEAIIYEETGDNPKIMRFPGGSTNQVSWNYSGKTFMKNQLIPEVIKRGYVYFDWNSCGDDAVAKNPTKNYIINSVFTGIQGKKYVNVLLHDSNYKWTLEALPEIIEKFQSEGYTFSTLDITSHKSQFIQ